MVFLSISLVLIAGHYKGFFRIPQVRSFLNIASRKLHDADISRISKVITQELQHTLPLFEAIGQSIIVLSTIFQGFPMECSAMAPIAILKMKIADSRSHG